MVLDETGRLRHDSRSPSPQPLDLPDRDYFKVHRTKQSVLYVGHPSGAQTSGSLLIGISKRLSHADGSFAGVVVGTMQLDYFKKLFEDVAFGPHSNITLARTDGTVLMRWPFDQDYIDRNISNAELYKHLAKARRGRFETTAVTDGVRRIVAYTQIADLPLVVGVGQSVDEV
jgi:hypothetical protein